MSWRSSFDEKFVTENYGQFNHYCKVGTIDSQLTKELKDFIEALLEEQNAKNIIEITAHCKEVTEALIKETEQRVSHYANFLEKELEGDGYIIEAIRERYERRFKGVE